MHWKRMSKSSSTRNAESVIVAGADHFSPSNSRRWNGYGDDRLVSPDNNLLRGESARRGLILLRNM